MSASKYSNSFTNNRSPYFLRTGASLVDGRNHSDPIWPRLIDMNLSPPIGQRVVKGVTWPIRGLAGKNSSFGPWLWIALLVQFRVLDSVESPCCQTGKAGTAAFIMDGTIWEKKAPRSFSTGWDSAWTSRPTNCSPRGRRGRVQGAWCRTINRRWGRRRRLRQPHGRRHTLWPR